jgi:hypothetical protein
LNVTRKVVWAVSFVVLCYLFSYAFAWMNKGCRSDGCMGVVIPFVFALFANVVLFIAGYGVLIWFYLKGHRPMMPVALGLEVLFGLFVGQLAFLFGSRP